MEPRLTLITLGVADLDRAVAFYRDVVGWTPTTASSEVAFFDLGGLVLALWPNRDLAAELALPPDSLGAYHGFALAHNLRSATAVDALFAELAAKGARITKVPAATAWGGYSGYFEDVDGHRWEVAHNPFWPLDADGRVVLAPA